MRERDRKFRSYVIAAVVFATLCIAVFFLFYAATVSADENLSEIQYKIIEVQEGDTMWEIARENMHPGFHDEKEYIDEVLRCNQMSTTQITTGHYIMVPYYTYE